MTEMSDLWEQENLSIEDHDAFIDFLVNVEGETLDDCYYAILLMEYKEQD